MIWGPDFTPEVVFIAGFDIIVISFLGGEEFGGGWCGKIQSIAADDDGAVIATNTFPQS